MINGIVIIHKEAGYTSHDVVAKMRGICGQRKIGHTGTLDPEAAGVLPMCLGNATKLCGLFTDQDKEYVARLLLGVKTDTQDMTGRVLKRHPVEVSEAEARRVILSFQGRYDQVPPMYSALKVNGKKLYELARAGREVERQARPVVIHELKILSCRLPAVEFSVSCSKGTYIRTLCADIGERLGCGGVMESLVRTRVGAFSLEEALTLDKLQKMKDQGMLEMAVRPVDSVFEHCPALHILEEYLRLPANGNAFLPQQTAEGRVYEEGAWVRVYEPGGRFIAIYAYDPALEGYKPVKMFLD